MGAIFMKLGLAPTTLMAFMLVSSSTRTANLENPMLKTVLGAMLVLAQLGGPGNGLPQVLTPAYKSSTPIIAGKKGEVAVSFNLLQGFAINRTPQMSLKLEAIPGVKMD